MKEHPMPELTVYNLKNQEEVNSLFHVLKEYPNIILEQHQTNNQGIKIGIKHHIDFNKEFEMFKEQFQSTLSKIRQPKLSFMNRLFRF